MRFILSFIFFGLLFYVISIYFPETFQTLVSWAAKVYNFLFNLISGIIDKINSMSSTPVHAPEHPVKPETPKQLAQFLGILFK